jgi:hypothetical protein
LPDFLGSAWRGSFGNALRTAVCTTQLPRCAGCALYRECDFPLIFDTPSDLAGQALLGPNEGVPNPYVLAPGWSGGGSLAEGDTVSLDVTLVGTAMVRKTIVFEALARAAANGIGPDRVPLRLIDCTPIVADTTELIPRRLLLRFTTPLRLNMQGKLVNASALRPRHVLGALVRRVSLFVQYHNAGEIDVDFQALKQRAAAAEFASAELVWRDWARHSARQAATIPMGGLMGSAVLPMVDLDPFWPFLRLAPALHIGKGAVMGLGAVTLDEAA